MVSPATAATGDFSAGASDGVADGFGRTSVGKRDSLSGAMRRVIIFEPFDSLMVGLVAEAVVDIFVLSDGEGMLLVCCVKVVAPSWC